MSREPLISLAVTLRDQIYLLKEDNEDGWQTLVGIAFTLADVKALEVDADVDGVSKRVFTMIPRLPAEYEQDLLIGQRRAGHSVSGAIIQ